MPEKYKKKKIPFLCPHPLPHSENRKTRQNRQTNGRMERQTDEWMGPQDIAV